MARKTKKADPKQVLSYRHGETRANNPEVGMVHAASDPDQPKTEWQYDPHLDPTLQFDSARASIETLIDNALASDDPDTMKMALSELKRLQAPYLNWTGKAERTSFEIDTVSLHVHERVDPATILANVSKRLKSKNGAEKWRQSDLFSAPFENLPLRQALDFYSHEKGWSNRLISGDSLLVMNSLLTKESMEGKVQVIYIDPPYGIKYGSNFQPFTSKRDVKDRKDSDLTQEPEMIKAFRDTWELGIHSYLTYLRDRLTLAWELLDESGSVFVQISDENLHYIKSMMEEIFGAEGFVALVPFRKKLMPLGAKTLEQMSDFLIWFCKDPKKIKYRHIYRDTNPNSKGRWTGTVGEGGNLVRLSKEERADLRIGASPANIFSTISQWAPSFSPDGVFPFQFQGVEFNPSAGQCWVASHDKMKRLEKANRLFVEKDSPRFVSPHLDYPYAKITSPWYDTAPASGKTYVVQTNENVIERCLAMTSDPGDLVLDPTCGSGTVAYVSEKMGRRWITCDTSRVAITLAKQRLMTASFDYYALRYPHEGLSGGFDYETAARITLKNIVNNPDIDTIYEEEHPKVEAALASLNEALKATPPGSFIPTQGARKAKPLNLGKEESLYEWEVPFDLPENWSENVKLAFDSFWVARKVMQSRIDQSLADHADQETLHDRPRIDKSRLRITGPFSVEAVPAPTVLALDELHTTAEADESVARSGETSRQSMWRNELIKTGIRGKGGAMMTFAEFETLPSLKYIHASGSLAETGERVVVSFGPEHAALEQRQVELALSEAESLRPAPKFILFCAFTFDPEAAKDIDEIKWPGMTVLKAQMNTDLLTEDLKKARSSNQSFWLMGQPDVEVRKRDDGTWEVEVNGFDYFDPKKGELVSGGKKQIAMWSLDTDYDQRSLMPHQVFFPMAGAKNGWNRLKKTIRAELDEDLMEQFHGTVSLPFEAGDNKCAAVKIVDDRGIESLKIVALDT